MGGRSREAVIDYEFLRGRQNETVVKELCVPCRRFRDVPIQTALKDG